MAQVQTTTAMQARADDLLSRRARWARGYSVKTGREFYLFSGSKGEIYEASVDGCTCRGYLYRGICSHAAAIRAAEADIEAAFATVALREYGRLFPEEDFA